MATMEGWTVGIAFSVLFVIIFTGVVISGMNDLYSEDHEVVGLDTDGFESAFENYQESQQEKIKGGDASFTSAVGLTVSTSWDVIVSTLTLIWDFFTGGWIRTIIVDYMRVDSKVAFILRGLWFIAIGFMVMKILFKVKT